MSDSQPPLHLPDYDTFSQSLQGLKAQHANHLADVQRLPLDDEAVAESVIHRFETCYACLCSVLRRYLKESFGESAVLKSGGGSKSCGEIFKEADQRGLLPSRRWRAYVDGRNDTAHRYDCARAQACLGVVGDFIEDADYLHPLLSPGA